MQARLSGRRTTCLLEQHGGGGGGGRCWRLEEGRVQHRGMQQARERQAAAAAAARQRHCRRRQRLGHRLLVIARVRPAPAAAAVLPLLLPGRRLPLLVLLLVLLLRLCRPLPCQLRQDKGVPVSQKRVDEQATRRPAQPREDERTGTLPPFPSPFCRRACRGRWKMRRGLPQGWPPAPAAVAEGGREGGQYGIGACPPQGQEAFAKLPRPLFVLLPCPLWQGGPQRQAAGGLGWRPAIPGAPADPLRHSHPPNLSVLPPALSWSGT